MSETTPYTTNPLKRIRTSLGLSQKKLAELAGVTPQSVLKYEQGLYQEPSDNIITALLTEAEEQGTPFSLLKLHQDYKKWRTTHQEAQQWIFDRIYTLPISADEHPFKTFRKKLYNPHSSEGYTVQGFAVLLALHPATVTEYDAGRVRNMPSIIREALERAGCRTNIISDLDEFGGFYYDSKHTVGAH
jgi:transcriptional regulator with XRE-family HTH domain